jgi:acetyl esterase/lipase
MIKVLFAIIFLVGIHISGITQSNLPILYKEVDTTRLFMEIYSPDSMHPDSSYPAMIYFFGGGWNGGSTQQFKPHAEYFSSRGVICFLVEYRVKTRNHTTPFESLMDAKSAVRFVRANASSFHVDPSKIIASGGSAGGHLAAATALITPFNEETDDFSVSCIPNALVLFNPVIDNGPGGYGYERVGYKYKEFSPLHNIIEGAPPTLFFLGTHDRLIPVETARYYKMVMEKVGSRCDLFLYEEAGHGFFNFRSPHYYSKTVYETDRFLHSLGYLKGEPTITVVDKPVPEN